MKNRRWGLIRIHPRGHLPYSTTDLAETPGMVTEDLVGDNQGGPRASWRTPSLWPTTMEPGVAIDLYWDGPGPPSLVCSREGCRERTWGRPTPTRVIVVSVTVWVSDILVEWLYQLRIVSKATNVNSKCTFFVYPPNVPFMSTAWLSGDVNAWQNDGYGLTKNVITAVELDLSDGDTHIFSQKLQWLWSCLG